MIINNKVIKDLNPCQNRFNNYLKFYKDKSHTLAQFMGLKNISHQDKLWVAFRLMHKDSVRLAAADIAESVLHIFETKYPNDDRPRKAIEAARSGNASAASAADSVYTTSNAVTSNAANYAAYAAAYAAYAASDVAYAADYAADYAAQAAAYAADYTDIKNYEKVIRKICLKYLK